MRTFAAHIAGHASRSSLRFRCACVQIAHSDSPGIKDWQWNDHWLAQSHQLSHDNPCMTKKCLWDGSEPLCAPWGRVSLTWRQNWISLELLILTLWTHIFSKSSGSGLQKSWTMSFLVLIGTFTIVAQRGAMNISIQNGPVSHDEKSIFEAACYIFYLQQTQLTKP